MGSKEKREWTIAKNRLDTFDLLINVLKEHEKSLDNLVNRLDTLIETLSTISGRLEYLSERI
jgi:hypothetical protein